MTAARTSVSEQKGYLDLRGLSSYASLGVPTLREYLKSGLPHFKLKGKLLVRRNEFDEWMEQYRVGSERLNTTVNDVIKTLKSDR